MALEILESKKGTKVVTATNLHTALKLSIRQYGAQVRKWLRDAYEFEDGIRRPQMYRDFAKRPRPGEPGKRAYEVFTDCWERGVLIRVTGDIIALSPPLIIEKAQVDQIVDTIRGVLQTLE